MKRRTLLQAGAGCTDGRADRIVRRANRRRARRTGAPELYGLLGRLPPRDRKVSAQLVSTEDRGAYTLEKLVLDLNGEEPAPAYFARPEGRDRQGCRPCCSITRMAAATRSARPSSSRAANTWANRRTRSSSPRWATTPCASTRGSSASAPTRTELDFFKDMLWHGRVLWGMMVYDSLKAVDYLVTRPDVDTQQARAPWACPWAAPRAQWLGALDPRLKVVVDICCLTDWHTLVEVGGLKGHGIYYYVPDLLNHFTDRADECADRAARAPVTGGQPGCAHAGGRASRRSTGSCKDVYASAGHPENWKLLRYDGGPPGDAGDARRNPPVVRRQAVAIQSRNLGT